MKFQLRPFDPKGTCCSVVNYDGGVDSALASLQSTALLELYQYNCTNNKNLI